MKFYSTKNKSESWSFKDAVIQGLAPDGGLFMPEYIEPFQPRFFDELSSKSFAAIAYEVALQLLGDSIPKKDLKRIVERTVSFDAPIVPIEERIWALELFHGPTLAFKDFGARFLAGLMEYFAEKQSKDIIVLAATSGDTGSAVANGFLNVNGVKVVILYPSGKVSPLQEMQLTTLGGNITAWEVKGTFDDCQRLVKQIFLDEDLRNKLALTSANSINLGRLIPQTFYYFHAWAQLKDKSKLVSFSVPSGNFGNLTAGVIARRLGLPLGRFIASTNANDVVPGYLVSRVFVPRPSIATISNAMDVGDPSNFARLLDLYNNDHAAMAKDIVGYSFSDEQTQKVMKDLYLSKKYVLDPHGAVAYLGLKKYLDDRSGQGIFFETAHPGKFVDTVERAIDTKIKLPEALEALKGRQKKSVVITGKLEEARDLLMKL